jgi:hypothetical protein
MASIDPVSFKVEGRPSSVRQAADESFATVLKTGAGAVTGAVAGGAAVAAPFVPGAAGVSAALGNAQAARGVIQNAVIGGGTPAVAAVPAGGTSVLDGLGAMSGGSPGDIVAATARLQESNQLFSMQYLELQEKMQQENRQYSTVSNVLKTRHESAKTAISNIR